ncbi:pyridoxal phosphate-dependent aminotransferase [Tistrella mobilis]|uniref:pyridoxal phosphate-dependent aminotransferase n=1 Tax=Tistrella mobilis TaxID=171437 RepID=UPI00355824C4
MTGPAASVSSSALSPAMGGGGDPLPPLDLSLGVIDPELLPAAADGAGAPPALQGRYAPRAGLPPLRQVLAAMEGVAPDQIVITTGASMALTAAFATLPADRPILLPRPGFPAYANIVRFLGRPAAFYDVMPPVDLVAAIAAALAAGPVPAAVVVNTPGNPLGNLLDADQVAAIQALCRDAGALLIVDETYAGLIFDDPAGRAYIGRGCPAGMLRILSFSKKYRMAGARLGYVVGTADHLARITDVHWTFAMSAPLDAQIMAAGIIARGGPADLSPVLRDLGQRAVERLAGTGAVALPPRGGPVLWVEVPHWPGDSRSLAGLCARAGVLVAPGAAFGIDQPPAIRCCFAVPRPRLDLALDRLAPLFARLADR